MRVAVVTCEHASAALPAGVDLGVDAAIVCSHVGWDPGALDVARAVSERLGAVLHAGRHTRLYVDLNRAEEGAGVIPTRSFGSDIPGNRNLPAGERARRLAVHRAYRTAVDRAVAAAVAEGGCLHLAVHSFAAEVEGMVRRYDGGVLFDPDRARESALAAQILAALAAAGLTVRANEPYLGTDDGLTTWLRGRYGDGGYAGLEIEVAQALTPARRATLAAAVAAAAAELCRVGIHRP